MGYAGIQKRKTGKANGYGKGDNAASVCFSGSVFGIFQKVGAALCERNKKNSKITIKYAQIQLRFFAKESRLS